MNDSKTEWGVENLYHIVLNVRDIDASVGFYELLGFRVLHDRRDAVWPDFVAKNFGMQRAQGRGVLMVLEHDPDGMILDLIEWTQPRVGPLSNDPDRIPQIIALRTRNVAAAYHELRAKGVRFTNELIGPDESLGLTGVCCALDPDGTVVELIEHAPGHRHSRTDDL